MYNGAYDEPDVLDVKGNCLTYKLMNTKQFRESVTKKVLLLKGNKKQFI